MPKQNLIIIPFGFPYNWPCDYEKQTARELSKNNIVIAALFNEGSSIKRIINKSFKEKAKNNFYIFIPINFIPFQRFPIIKNINYFLALLQLKFFLLFQSHWKKYQKIVWLFPVQTSYPQVLSLKNYLTVYDCVDYVGSLNWKQDKIEKQRELRIIKKTDIVFVNSHSLLNLKKNLHKHVYLVPQGFALNEFSKIKKFTKPKDLQKIPAPRIGFIGNINYRLDFMFIEKLARFCPEYSFVFIGPIDPDIKQDKISFTSKHLKELSKVNNIYFLGKKRKKDISKYIYYFDFGFIPYNTNQKINKYCYPMKVFEYFYMEKPVISTAIEELKELQPYVTIVKNADEAKKAIKKIVKSGWPEKYKKEQKKLAINNSWQKKIEEINQILFK